MQSVKEKVETLEQTLQAFIKSVNDGLRQSREESQKVGDRLTASIDAMKEDTRLFKEEVRQLFGRLDRERREADEREVRERCEADAREERDRREADEREERDRREADEREERERREANEREERERCEADERLARMLAEMAERSAKEKREADERLERQLREAAEKSERERREADEQLERELRAADERLAMELRAADQEQRREVALRAKDWIDWSRKMGKLVEDIVTPALGPALQEHFGVDAYSLFTRPTRRQQGESFEADILAITAHTVYLVEVKSNLKPEHVAELLEKAGQFRRFFPDYDNKLLVPILATITPPPEVLKHATRMRLYVMGFREYQYMEIVNFDEVRRLGQDQ